MKKLGQARVTARPHSGGGWSIELACPIQGCDSPASLLSEQLEGPYQGCCASQHRLFVPHFDAK